MDTTSNQLSTDQILAAVTQLSLPDLDQVFDRVLSLRAERKAPRPPMDEQSLLARARQGLPANLRQRLAELRAKREDETITDIEYDELTDLTMRSEEFHAERMEALVKLARLRGVALPALMDQLGIHFPEHV